MAGARGPIKVIAGNAHPALADAIARELNLPAEAAEVGVFADGETRVRLAPEVRDATVFLVQPTCPPVNENLMVLALLADAARAAGAARVVAVVPYFGYARQDRRGGPGDPRSARVAAGLLGAVGVDDLVTIDLHTPALESAFPMPLTQLAAHAALVPVVQARGVQDLVVVAPDAGAMKRAQAFAAAAGAGAAVVAKDRPRQDEAVCRHVLGEVRGRSCLIVDDMASTGRTLVSAAEVLRRAGVREVSAAFTHPVMAPGAAERLSAVGFSNVLTTDSIPIPAFPWLQVAPTAPLLARALRALLGEIVVGQN